MKKQLLLQCALVVAAPLLIAGCGAGGSALHAAPPTAEAACAAIPNTGYGNAFYCAT